MLILNLKNFKCYSDKTFTFPQGIVHISGESGKGKSSIFEALCFVLYNEGKNNHIIKKGEKNVQVELSFNCDKSIHIFRSRNPNKLMCKYDDNEIPSESAQNFINEHFGTKDIFMISSYIDQYSSESFIKQTPQQRLEILQKLTDNGIDIQSLVDKVKDAKKCMEDELKIIMNTISVQENNYKKLPELPEIKDEVNVSLIPEKEAELKLKKSLFIKLSDKYVESIMNAKSKATLYQNVLKSEEQIQNKTQEISDIKYIGDKELSLKNNQLQEFLVKKNEAIKLSIHKKKLDELKSRLVDIESLTLKIKKYKEQLKENEKLYELIEELSEITISEQDIQNLKHQLDNEYGKLLNCPECGKCVKLLSEEELVKWGKSENKLEYNKTKIEKIKKTILDYQTKLDRKQHLLTEIDERSVSQDDINKLRTKIKKLEKEIAQQENINEEIKNIEDNIIIEESDIPNINEEQLRDEININNQKKKDLNRLKKEIQTLMDEKERYEKSLETLTLLNLRNPEVILSDKNNVGVEIEQLETELPILRNYKIYIDKKSEKETLEKEISELKVQCRKKERKISSLDIITKLIKEAKSSSLSNTVDVINQNIRDYLNAFFNDPISLIIDVFRELKNGNEKPEVNIKIMYKDFDDLEIKNLSGGEISRISIAFLLTLNEMFNSKIIMIDEATSSLDENLTAKVIDCIKENCSNKIVMITAHQCVVGTFETTIEL